MMAMASTFNDKPVDMTVANTLFEILRCQPFVSTCRDALRKRLFSEGVVFLKGFREKRVQPPDVQMQELIDDYWIPFARDALDCLLVYGVVPFRLLRVDDKQVPIVPVSGTYKLTYRIEPSGLCTFSGKMVNGLDGEEISVLSGFGYDPSAGSLNSIISSCVPMLSFIQTLHEELITSEALKNSPVIYTESQQKEIKEGEGLTYDYYADAQTMKKLPSTTFQRSAKDVQQLQAQREAYGNAIRSLRSNKTSAQLFAEQNAQGALDRIVPLPPGQKLVKMSASSSRSDFVAILKLKHNQVAALFGLPIEMVLADNANAKSDQTGAHETFRSTILFWQTLLGRVLTTVHSSMSSSSHDDALKKLQKSEGASKDALYKLKSQECIIIHFPVKIFGTSDETLSELYNEEIIDRKTYAEFRLRNAGLPLDLLFRTDDPLSSADHKRQYVEPEPVQPAVARAAPPAAARAAAPTKKAKKAKKVDVEKERTLDVEKKKKASQAKAEKEKKNKETKNTAKKNDETTQKEKKTAKKTAANKRKASDTKKTIKRKKK